MSSERLEEGRERLRTREILLMVEIGRRKSGTLIRWDGGGGGGGRGGVGERGRVRGEGIDSVSESSLKAELGREGG